MTTHLVCPSCSRSYAYALDTCTWCGVALKATTGTRERIIGVTRVDVPSTGHEEVPYWVALVQDEAGFKYLHKLEKPVGLGDELSTQLTSVQAGTVGIVGTGTMGVGLAGLFVGMGWRVILLSRQDAAADDAREVVLDRLARSMDEQEITECASRLIASSHAGSLGECDVVIESVVEDLPAKRAVLRSIEPHLRADALLVTNTSGLSLDALAEVLERPERFGALHFFNPVSRMKLVETSVARASRQGLGDELEEIAASLGKTPIRVAARPAFVVNRVLMPLINEAVRSLEEGAADAEHIDEAIRLGLNHPMGPLALADLIGLDVVVEIMDNLVLQTEDDAYVPRDALRELVSQGHLGRKTKRGFYTYE